MDESANLQTRANNAINDAVESLWETLMRANLNIFMGGPTTIAIAAGDQEVTLISVADPLVVPTLSDVVEGALLEHVVYCAYSLVTESGTETLISPTSNRTVAANNVCACAAPAFVSGAVGWNCYMGTAAARLAKQNYVTPIDFADSFQEPASGEIDKPDAPSPPTENTTGDDIFYIRHLDCQMPDQGYKSYQASDINSLLSSRMAQYVALSSQWQNYVYDLVNQTKLELRPAAGMAFTPRYFYVKRPRRLRFDNSPLPFLTIPSTAFLRSYAISKLMLSIREFESWKAYKQESEDERLRCELAVMQMNRNVNEYITLYC